MVIISGNVPTYAIGEDAFQEADTVGITRPIVKHNFLVKDVKDLPLVLKKAFHIAQTGRPGPVLIDIPKDISMHKCAYSYPKEIEMRSYKPVDKGHAGQIRKALQLLLQAERPMIYAGGGVDSSVKSAKLVRDAAVFDLETVVNAAVLDVRTRFYTVLLTHEQVGVQEENVRLFQRELQDARNQFHAGTVSNFEVLRAQVSLANAQPDLIAARNNYRNAIEQLRQSLGVPSAPRGVAQSFPEIVGTLGVTAEAFDLESALAAAREHRPELLRLGKLQNAGEENVTTARSTYYPTLAAFAGYEGGGASLVNNTNPFLKGWLAGVQSNWAIFDGRATAGRVRQAKSLVEQTRLSYASVELAIDVEVRQALSALQEAAELVAASKQTIAEAEEALRLANARYHAGSATQLDVLTSQVALTQARTNALLANYQYSVALAALHKAMGIGDAPSRE